MWVKPIGFNGWLAKKYAVYTMQKVVFVIIQWTSMFRRVLNSTSYPFLSKISIHAIYSIKVKSVLLCRFIYQVSGYIHVLIISFNHFNTYLFRWDVFYISFPIFHRRKIINYVFICLTYKRRYMKYIRIYIIILIRLKYNTKTWCKCLLSNNTGWSPISATSVCTNSTFVDSLVIQVRPDHLVYVGEFYYQLTFKWNVSCSNTLLIY